MTNYKVVLEKDGEACSIILSSETKLKTKNQISKLVGKLPSGTEISDWWELKK